MASIPVGLQLYSIRTECARDLPGSLAAVASMGYEGVEFAGYYGYQAKDIRKLLDDDGLKCCGTHTSLDSLLGDELPRTIEFNQVLGNRYLIVPGLPVERRNSSKAWLDTATLFNQIAEQLKPAGMLTGYHNHDIEFKPMTGGMPFDLFFGHTNPEVVMQIDLGNALVGGGDPVDCLRRYPGRATTVHLKEYSRTNAYGFIGEGAVNWLQVFQLCETTGGTQWYIVEYEADVYPPLHAVRRCRENLRKMGR